MGRGEVGVRVRVRVRISVSSSVLGIFFYIPFHNTGTTRATAPSTRINVKCEYSGNMDYTKLTRVISSCILR